MPITSAICTSFKEELLRGDHRDTHQFKVALVKSSPAGTIGKGTSNYSSLGADEATGTGYSAGGVNLAATPTIGTLGDWAYIFWAGDPNWTSSTISASGAVVYNSNLSNATAFVISFGVDKTSSNGTFTVFLGTAFNNSLSVTFASTTITRTSGDFQADGYKIGQTIITDDSANPGPYVLTGVSTNVLTASGAGMTSGGPRSVSLRAVAFAW